MNQVFKTKAIMFKLRKPYPILFLMLSFFVPWCKIDMLIQELCNMDFESSLYKCYFKKLNCILSNIIDNINRLSLVISNTSMQYIKHTSEPQMLRVFVS